MKKDSLKKYADAEEKIVADGINRAIDIYIESRQEKVPDFVKKYFSLAGALKLHKKALSADIIKGPINISWSLAYTGIRIVGSVFRLVGIKRVSSGINKLPRGFETKVQKEVKWLIYTELLELPFEQAKRESTKDALFEEILNQPEIEGLFVKYLSTIKMKSQDPKFRAMLGKNLQEYSTSRTAAADLAGSIITIAVGTTLFKQMTPGAMATGSAVATAIAQQTAISNFFLGSTLGSVWYSIFPASASLGLIAAATGSIMAAMAVVTSFAGIITDPVQAKLGIHQRRLRKFIDALGNELKGSGKTRFEIRDHYFARVFDLLDVVKTAAMTVVK